MTNMEKLIAALVGPAQDLENAFQQLLLLRTIDLATGIQLDQIGTIVGQLRLGLDDTTYRQYLRARVIANRSQGHFEDLITVAALILNNSAWTVLVKNEGTATVRIVIGGAALTDTIGDVIYTFEFAAKEAGVRVVAEWSTAIPADTFTLDGTLSTQDLDFGHIASDDG